MTEPCTHETWWCEGVDRREHSNGDVYITFYVVCTNCGLVGDWSSEVSPDLLNDRTIYWGKTPGLVVTLSDERYPGVEIRG